MPQNVYKDWCRAALVFELLDDWIDNDDEKCFGYTLFFQLGLKLIDLLDSVKFALDDYKKEN